MAVPAHDSRDHEFALKYDLPIHTVVIPSEKNCNESGNPYEGGGVLVNSANPTSGLDINGLSCKEASLKVINWLEKTGHGKKKVIVYPPGVTYFLFIYVLLTCHFLTTVFYMNRLTTN